MPDVLLPRARRVLELLATGLTVDEVAVRLGLPSAEVRYELRRAMGTLEANSKLQAIVNAIRRGLIDPKPFL